MPCSRVFETSIMGKKGVNDRMQRLADWTAVLCSAKPYYVHYVQIRCTFCLHSVYILCTFCVHSVYIPCTFCVHYVHCVHYAHIQSYTYTSRRVGNRASGCERFEKKAVMALWRRTRSCSTMNLNFPGENQKGFKGRSGIYSILLLPNDAF